MSFSTISVPSSVSRRAAALLALSAALFVVLLLSWHSAPASADTYPPSTPSFSIAPTSESQVPSAAPSSSASSQAGTNGSRDQGLSSTGFQALAATTIAVALIGSGAIFLGLGRRRRHS